MSSRAALTRAEEDTRARGARLAEFSCEVLDWSAVLALFRPFARSALGRRALEQCVPLAETLARAAIERLLEWETAGSDLGEPPLGGLCDAPLLLARAAEESRALMGEELLAIAGFLRCAAALREWLGERRGQLPANARVGQRLPDLGALRAELEAGLDSSGAPKDEASPVLGRLRVELRALTRQLESALKELAHRPSARTALADGHVGQVHQRHGRWVLAIKATHLGQVPGAVLDRSASGETLYVEPREFADLGNRMVELRADEAREASRLFVQWTRAVLAKRSAIETAAGALADFELGLVGRDMARAYGGRAPLVPGMAGAADELVLRGARHPLLVEQERAGRIPRCVPLDLRLGGSFDQLLITGPNTGGKTLVLKTAGVCVLLASAGLPILADAGSTVPLYRAVAADIGDEQEVEQSLSTFASHVARIAAGLQRAGRDVLLLLDEVGGATDPEEGAALGESLLEHLLERRVPTLATTHLAGLIEYAWRHARVENASVEFDFERLAPTYRLLVGTPGASQALDIARRLGLPAAIVDRARGRMARQDDRTAALIRDLGEARLAAERARAEAEERLAQALERQRALDQGEAELERRRGELAAELEGELERRLAPSAGALERLENLLAQVSQAQRQALAEPVAALGAAVGAARLSEYRERFLARLAKGSPVWLPRYGRRCPVLQVDRTRRRLRVRLGQRDMDVSFDDVAAFEAL